MTRINSAIPVKNLTDEHLLAEHREIKRLPYQWCKSFHNGYLSFAPEKFTLGWDYVKSEYMKDYVPTEEERQMLVERITDRIVNGNKPYYHYYGRQISKEEALAILENF